MMGQGRVMKLIGDAANGRSLASLGMTDLWQTVEWVGDTAISLLV